MSDFEFVGWDLDRIGTGVGSLRSTGMWRVVIGGNDLETAKMFARI